MQSINYRTAVGNFTEVLNNAEAGEEIEITRRGRESSVIVSKKVFDAYKRPLWMLSFRRYLTNLMRVIKLWSIANAPHHC